MSTLIGLRLRYLIVMRSDPPDAHNNEEVYKEEDVNFKSLITRKLFRVNLRHEIV